MNRVMAAFDLDDDHNRLWVNAILEHMPDFVVVSNTPTDRAQTVTYIPMKRRSPFITMKDNGDYDLTCPECGRNAYYSVNYFPKFCESCGVEFDYD